MNAGAMNDSPLNGEARHVVVVQHAQEIARRGAELVDAWACADVAARGVCSIVLAGGTTPLALYRAWAANHRVDATRLEFFHGDERCVPRDHADSNHRAVREALLDPMGVPLEREHAMDGADPDRERAARRYAALLPQNIDVLLLGLGPDGHTASLFPGDRAALYEHRRRVVHVIGSKPPPHRLTITPPVVDCARRVLVLASGAAKAEAIARAFEHRADPLATPVAIAAHRAWLVDEEAAAQLPRAADWLQRTLQ
jgi:6-phosphogluconolactonase